LNRRAFAIVALGALVLAGAAGTPAAQTAVPRQLAVAAASDLQAVMPRLAPRFERESGIAISVSLGSSGNFFAQIQNGAPFDVFLSADIDYPQRLIAGGRADADSLTEYATGRLVLWARKDAAVDVRRGLDVLRDARVRRIAIANPAHAPYGRAAVAALTRAGLYEAVRSRLVLGENIAQAAQFAASGNADAGLIALSIALTPALMASGTYIEVPADTYAPIQQAAIVVATSRRKDAARRFLRFLEQPDTIELLRASGFGAAHAAP